MSEQNKLSDHDRKEIEKFKKYCSREMQGVEKLKYQGFNNEQIITIQEKEITALKSQLEKAEAVIKKVPKFEDDDFGDAAREYFKETEINPYKYSKRSRTAIT